MLTWQEFEQAAPEIAANGRELIERFQFVLVGTLTKDGSPRITPVEAYIIDGHLLVNMIPRSLKALDLLRDPRVYVHAPVTAKGGDPEFKLGGRADVLTDESLKGKLDDLFWELIKWRPRPDSHYFEILGERAAWVVQTPWAGVSASGTMRTMPDAPVYYADVLPAAYMVVAKFGNKTLNSPFETWMLLEPLCTSVHTLLPPLA